MLLSAEVLPRNTGDSPPPLTHNIRPFESPNLARDPRQLRRPTSVGPKKMTPCSHVLPSPQRSFYRIQASETIVFGDRGNRTAGTEFAA